jgi:hypothetical protein
MHVDEAAGKDLPELLGICSGMNSYHWKKERSNGSGKGTLSILSKSA